MGVSIVGHAVVSADGMIADASRRMPASLRNDADWQRFQAALDDAALVVLGRLGSRASPARSGNRIRGRRPRRSPPAAGGRGWRAPRGPAGMTFGDVLAELGIEDGTVAVTGGQRVKANIASFDLALSNYFNGIPTKIATKATGVAFPLPTDGADEGVKNLIALGITDLNLDYELDASWDQATHTVKVDKVSVNGNDLGSFAVAAMIGNVTDQVFDLDPKVMQVALLNLTAQSLKFDVTDLGLGDKLIPMLAQEQGVPVDGFRTKMAGVAEGAALQLLGATDAARALGQAVGAFIGGTAKSLSVTVTAKDPNGIGMPLLMQAQNDPTVLTNAIEITGASQ
jgi:hypothetical protein